MSTNIYDIANELERAIRNLPEYKAVEAAKVSVNNDLEAKNILEDYASFQKSIQSKLQTGEVPTEDDQTRLMDLNKKIQTHSLLSEYFNKQQQLSVYIADLERIIFNPLNDLL